MRSITSLRQWRMNFRGQTASKLITHLPVSKHHLALPIGLKMLCNFFYYNWGFFFNTQKNLTRGNDNLSFLDLFWLCWSLSLVLLPVESAIFRSMKSAHFVFYILSKRTPQKQTIENTTFLRLTDNSPSHWSSVGFFWKGLEKTNDVLTI